MRAATSVAALVASQAGPAAACAAAPDGVAMADSVAVADGAVSRAWFERATDTCDHRILGPRPDASVLAVRTDRRTEACGVMRAEAGADHLLEDTAPRLVDLDGNGRAEVVVVRTDIRLGAQLAVYGEGSGGRLVLRAATPPIGQRHRWVAPAAVADLDGDGRVEPAYVDRPHLARRLRVWRYEGGGLREVARVDGVTNHRIEERDIAGGLRDCGAGPEIVLASADWTRCLAVRLSEDALQTRDVGPWPGEAVALPC